MARKTVQTELAAIYWVMLHRPGVNITLITKAEEAQAKRTIYDLCKQQKITNYGDHARGQALWDLVELHKVYNTPKKGYPTK